MNFKRTIERSKTKEKEKRILNRMKRDTIKKSDKGCEAQPRVFTKLLLAN